MHTNSNSLEEMKRRSTSSFRSDRSARSNTYLWSITWRRRDSEFWVPNSSIHGKLMSDRAQQA